MEGIEKSLRRDDRLEVYTVFLTQAADQTPPQLVDTHRGTPDRTFLETESRGRIGRPDWLRRTVSACSRILGLAGTLDGLVFRRSLKLLLDRRGADIVVAYHWRAALASVGIPNRILLLGDPLLASKLARAKKNSDFPGRNQGNNPLSAVKTVLGDHVVKIVEKLAVWRASGLGMFSPHHASAMSKQLGCPVSFIHTPWVQDTERSATFAQDQTVFTLGLMGQLGGTATRAGLRFFAREILPGLQDSLDRGQLKIRVSGASAPGEAIEVWKDLWDAGAVYVGHRYPPSIEFQEINALVVPTNIPLGNRLRILDSWAHGVPVLAHVANLSGIPELSHTENCLLWETAAEFKECLTLIQSNQEQVAQRLVEGGRATLRDEYSPVPFLNEFWSLLGLTNQ